MENLIFYFLIFCIGTVFGSFFTLAVYRIPLHQDITHKRSYCPKCNHKLSFLDMIPILSYIFLGGKCRYCKEKIRIRYLLLEVLTGLVFVLIAMSIKINLINMELDKLIYLVFTLLYVAGIIIIAGIDKEKRDISKPVISYELILLTIYMIYLYIVENANIYRYVIYLFVMLFLTIINVYKLKKDLKTSYLIDIIILSIIMSGFTFEWCFAYTVVFTLIAISLEILIHKLVNMKNKHTKKEQVYSKNIPIAFYLCSLNIVVLIITNMMANGWFE